MNEDPKLKPDIAALKKRLSEDPGFAAQVKGEQAAMRPELALFFRDLRNHLLHVIDMSKGEHYLDVVRLNAQALIRRMGLLFAAPAEFECMSAEAAEQDAARFRMLLQQHKHWLGVFACNPDGTPSDSLDHAELKARLDALIAQEPAPGCKTPSGCHENGCLGWCDEHRPETGI